MTNTVLLSRSVSCNLFLSHFPLSGFPPFVSFSSQKPYLFDKQDNLRLDPYMCLFLLCAFGFPVKMQCFVLCWIDMMKKGFTSALSSHIVQKLNTSPNHFSSFLSQINAI